MKKIIYLLGGRGNRNLYAKAKRRGRYRTTRFMVMSVVQPIHAVTGAVDMPSSKGGRKDRAQEISDACAVSTYVTISGARITAVNLTITNYGAATRATRPGLYKLMNDSIKGLLFTFQAAANADPANSVAILESGGFRVREQHINVPQVFGGIVGTDTGTVVLTAESGGRTRHCHDWLYSSDQITWIRLSPTTGATKPVSGLPSQLFAYFKHELYIKDVPQGMSQVIKILVQ